VRRKTLSDVLARRIPEPTTGDLTIELAVWCAEHDNDIDLEVWALRVDADRAQDREHAAH